MRALARRFALPTADKSESMGLCFVGERGNGTYAFTSFLDQYVDAARGELVTPDGQCLGYHRGLHSLTVGQRARIAGVGERYYVAAKDPATRRVTVVPGLDHPWLQCTALQADSFAWSTGTPPPPHTPLAAQVRYRQDAVACTVSACGAHGIEVQFQPSVTAVAPGQTVAVYTGDLCLGSGVIDRVVTMASSAKT